VKRLPVASLSQRYQGQMINGAVHDFRYIGEVLPNPSQNWSLNSKSLLGVCILLRLSKIFLLRMHLLISLLTPYPWSLNRPRSLLLLLMLTLVQVKKDDSECVSASSDGSCIIWDLHTFKRRTSLFANTFFKSVIYHPDESQLVTTGTDRKVCCLLSRSTLIGV